MSLGYSVCALGALRKSIRRRMLKVVKSRSRSIPPSSSFSSSIFLLLRLGGALRFSFLLLVLFPRRRFDFSRRRLVFRLGSQRHLLFGILS
jgi:hypothetical protein